MMVAPCSFDDGSVCNCSPSTARVRRLCTRAIADWPSCADSCATSRAAASSFWRAASSCASRSAPGEVGRSQPLRRGRAIGSQRIGADQQSGQHADRISWT